MADKKLPLWETVNKKSQYKKRITSILQGVGGSEINREGEERRGRSSFGNSLKQFRLLDSCREKGR